MKENIDIADSTFHDDSVNTTSQQTTNVYQTFLFGLLENVTRQTFSEAF